VAAPGNHRQGRQGSSWDPRLAAAVAAFEQSTAALEREVNNWGMAAEKVKAYEAGLNGLPLDKVVHQLDLIEQKTKLALGDSLRTPLEQAQKFAEELDKLFNHGEFKTPEDRALAGRAFAKVANDLIGQAGVGHFRLSPSALRGSAEAYGLAVHDDLQRQNASRNPADLLKQAIDVLQQQDKRRAEEAKTLIDTIEQQGIGILTGPGG
jgi:hypothetical protein